MKALRVEEILKELTLEEKISLVQGATFFGTQPIERLGIPRVQFLDGGTGINFEQLFGDFYSRQGKADVQNSTALARVIEYYYEPERLNGEEKKIHAYISNQLLQLTGEEYAPSCFPTGMLLGATFDPAVCREVGRALGDEARLFGIDILLGTPNINIQRDPRGGRLFESFSEDPKVVEMLAPEMVKGVQEKGIIANVKHFAANNQETNRLGINEIISERALEEIYYPGFRACVKEGGAKTLMSAYNAINGIPCTENEKLLREKLRVEWGFDGCVVSDWGAVYSPVKALLGGTDLAMPGPLDAAEIRQGITDGLITETELDRNVLAVLGMISMALAGRKGEKKPCVQLKKETDKVAYEVALGGCVLLKNRDFPLRNEGSEILLMTGSGKNKLLDCGIGSAGITTSRTSSLAETLKKNLCSMEVLTIQNPSAGNSEADTIKAEMKEHCAQGKRVHIIFIASLNGMEGNDRSDLFLQEKDRHLLDALVTYKKEQDFILTLVLNVCGPVDLCAYEEAIDNLWICFLPGMEGSRALADLMCGKANPSGKLPITFPRRYADTPTCLNFPGDGKEVYYGEGIYIGYRYYDKKEIEPAYPFGFGLSYTDFEVAFVLPAGQKEAFRPEHRDKMKHFNLDKDREFTVKVKLSNIGQKAGAEVIQIYVADPVSTLSKPVKELKKFQKVYLEAGEEREIPFTFTKEDFAAFDPNLHAFTVEEGVYDLILATSSRDEKERVRICLDTKSPYSYGENTPIKIFYENPALKIFLTEFWDRFGLERQILESNYNYTPQRTLKEILPANTVPEEEWKSFCNGIDALVKKW